MLAGPSLAMPLMGLLFWQVAAQPPDVVPVTKPRWNTGDSWIVQTSTAQVQERHSADAGARRQKAAWLFRVEGNEQLGPDNCLKVAVNCSSSSNKSPVVIFWADEATGQLRQVQTNIPSQGKIRSAVERYDSDLKSSAVMGTLSALPLDMPSFSQEENEAKDSKYRVFGAPVGAKDAGLIGFGYQVHQAARQADPEFIRKTLPDGLAKSVKPKAYIDVSMTDGQRTVRQLWSDGDSWPAYSNNGITESWLVSVKKANEQ